MLPSSRTSCTATACRPPASGVSSAGGARTSTGGDVQMKTLKFYFAFKRFRNFACVEVHPKNRVILVYVKVDSESVELQPGFTRDMRGIGHYGTGDLEIAIRDKDDLERAKPLIVKSYESS
ncbi:MAG TPA: DUF5655 domain-containing protein [Methanomassiliicoccaceae archaeon]|nr:DUF5655 domain-containing protein [Methanomassiliicoccaceae archaeon]HOQ26576.1 DUF5655 domain-containing protein [Methanomassiliicoccaceae archaeon]HPP44290.1 DUF5655 domain-containing protein [Methanomassiliicoccaceae archaeon]HPT74491.1 DUF5655 domain-containing protein [Methanomassiliicoccaceae archaeon]HQD87453.1 DUF5655 domain-containing protein [Methanomassiliicoccaceae archaeon]